jgi:outer membrane lipoprotein carrier protein
MWQLLLVSLAFATKTPTADEIIGKVQSFYQDTQKLRADFRQEFTNTTFGKTSKSDGKLYIAKPGKMRWDYDKPEKKYFISDGTTLWVYEEAAKQAFEKSLKDEILPVAVSFLYGKGDLRAEFTASLDPGKYGGPEDLVVKLVPKKPEAQYKTLWLVVDAADFHVKESVILEATDNVNHFTFLNVKQNAQAKVEEKHFKFVPPSGVKVIKAGEEGKQK